MELLISRVDVRNRRWNTVVSDFVLLYVLQLFLLMQTFCAVYLTMAVHSPVARLIASLISSCVRYKLWLEGPHFYKYNNIMNKYFNSNLLKWIFLMSHLL